MTINNSSFKCRMSSHGSIFLVLTKEPAGFSLLLPFIDHTKKQQERRKNSPPNNTDNYVSQLTINDSVCSDEVVLHFTKYIDVNVAHKQKKEKKKLFVVKPQNAVLVSLVLLYMRVCRLIQLFHRQKKIFFTKIYLRQPVISRLTVVVIVIRSSFFSSPFFTIFYVHMLLVKATSILFEN